MTDTTEPTRARTNWDAALSAACAEYFQKTGKAISAFAMIHPSQPGIVVRVGDGLPYSFENAKTATSTVRVWSTAP